MIGREGAKRQNGESAGDGEPRTLITRAHDCAPGVRRTSLAPVGVSTFRMSPLAMSAE